MTTRTIEYVKTKPREWEGPNGTVYFIGGSFDDGDEFSVGTGKDQVEAVTKSLQELIGKPTDFELGESKEYNGVLTWKLKGWPGKPKGQYRGAGGGMSNRQVALLAAATYTAPKEGITDEAVYAYAEEFEAWLGKGAPQPQPQPEQGTTDEGQPAGGASLPQINSLKAIAQKLGWSEAEALEVASVGAWQALTDADARRLIKEWQEQVDNREPAASSW